MTYAAKLTAGLSPEARTALTSVGTSRQGATIPDGTQCRVVRELLDRELIGVGLGLTRAGSIAREHIQEEDLALLF